MATRVVNIPYRVHDNGTNLIETIYTLSSGLENSGNKTLS